MYTEEAGKQNSVDLYLTEGQRVLCVSVTDSTGYDQSPQSTTDQKEISGALKNHKIQVCEFVISELAFCRINTVHLKSFSSRNACFYL